MEKSKAKNDEKKYKCRFQKILYSISDKDKKKEREKIRCFFYKYKRRDFYQFSFLRHFFAFFDGKKAVIFHRERKPKIFTKHFSF